MNNNSLDENPHKIKSLKFNTVMNALRMSLTVIVPLITFPYVSRIFLTEGSGKINFANSVVQIFTLFATLGIYIYGIREGAQFRNDINKISKFAQELLFINIISTIITYIIFLICVFCLPIFQNYRIILVISGITIIFSFLAMDWVFGVFEDYTYITLRQIIGQVFAIVSLFLFIHKAEDIYLYMSLSVAPTVLINISSVIYSRKYISYRYNKKYNYEIVKHIIPILILFATLLATRIYNTLDTVLLGIMTSDHNVGIYSAAVKVNTVIITCFGAMSPVFMPRITNYIKSNDYTSYFSLLKKILKIVIGIGFPAVIGLIMLSNNIIKIIAGGAFEDASITMKILAPIILFNSCSNILFYDMLTIYKKENYVLLCTAIGAVLNLIISMVLIPFLKENGAAVGSLISEFIVLAVAFILCYKTDKKIISSIPNIFNYIIGSFAIIICCIVCCKFINNIFAQTIFSVLGSISIYFAIMVLLKDMIGLETIRFLKQILHKIKNI